MLPSSINGWFQSLAGPQEAAGLSLHKGSINWCHAACQKGAWRVTHRETIPLPLLDLERPPAEGVVPALAEALARIAPDAGRRYLPLQVTLPDPLGYADTLELEAIPKSPAARRDLVRWHFEKDMHMDGAAYDIDSQDLSKDGQTCLLLGQALDRRWLATVKTALEQANLRAWSINTSFCHRINAYGRELRIHHAGVGLVSLTADAWSVGFLDELGRLRFLRSRWRKEGEDFFVSVSTEIETLVRAYAQGPRRRPLAQLYLVGEVGDCLKLVETLNPRLDRPCMVLPPPGAGEEPLPGASGTEVLFSFIARAA